MSVKQFLSSAKTKDEPTVYLSKKALRHFKDVQHLCSSQEEADTRIIFYSLDVSRRGATGLYIQSPDTDVFVLAIHRYHELCRNTYTGVGNLKRVIPLRPIVNALGAAKAEALLGFHAFTGSDTTGRFAGKGEVDLLASPGQMYHGGGIGICCLRNLSGTGS